MSRRVSRLSALLSLAALLIAPAGLSASDKDSWEKVRGLYILIYNGEGAAEGGPEALGVVVRDLGYKVAYIEDLEDLPAASGRPRLS